MTACACERTPRATEGFFFFFFFSFFACCCSENVKMIMMIQTCFYNVDLFLSRFRRGDDAGGHACAQHEQLGLTMTTATTTMLTLMMMMMVMMR